MRLFFLTSLISLCAIGCSTPFPERENTKISRAGGSADWLLDLSIRAHGNDPYRSAQEIGVSFEGEWGFVAKMIQPELTDPGFRISSSEVYDLLSGKVSQIHRGSSGTKEVVRTTDDVRVKRNGALDRGVASRETAALVADAYRMFLTSPSYLRHRDVRISRMSDAQIGGVRYHRIRATLEPGFGFSEKDELIYWIDSKSYLLRRVSFTIEGFALTRGSHITVDFLEYIERSGTLYPSKFEERVLAPVKILAHEWVVTDLEVR